MKKKHQVKNDQTAVETIDRGLQSGRIDPTLAAKLLEKRQRLIERSAPSAPATVREHKSGNGLPTAKPVPSTPKAVLEGILGEGRSVHTMTLEEGHILEERFGLEMAIHTTAMKIEEEGRVQRLVDKAARQSQPQPAEPVNSTLTAKEQGRQLLEAQTSPPREDKVREATLKYLNVRFPDPKADVDHQEHNDVLQQVLPPVEQPRVPLIPSSSGQPQVPPAQPPDTPQQPQEAVAAPITKPVGQTRQATLDYLSQIWKEPDKGKPAPVVKNETWSGLEFD